MTIAGIVLFNPDKDILIQNIEAIINQVESIILVDNASSVPMTWLYDFIKNRNIICIKNSTNKGIAFALNQIMQYGEANGAEWVLTLDQDSVSPENLMDKYLQYELLPKTAILSPIIRDRNNKDESVKVKDGVTEIRRCITSASLNNVKVWKQIGGFNEKLFIDYVDFEYCCRVREHGFKIYQVNEVVLLHRLGDMNVRKLGEKNVHVTNHNEIRKYYYSRNACCCHRWHKKEYSLNKLIYHLGSLVIKTILFENQKIVKLRAICRGILDSKKVEQISER